LYIRYFTNDYTDRLYEINAKCAQASSIVGKNIEGQWVGFVLRPLTLSTSAESEWLAEYWYVDRDVNVQGTQGDYGYAPDIKFDCSFKKGWNLVYVNYVRGKYGESVVVVYSTQKPSNLTFGWFWYQY